MQVYFFVFVVLPMMRGQGRPAPQKPWEAAEGLNGKCPRRPPGTPSRTRPSWTPPPPAWWDEAPSHGLVPNGNARRTCGWR
jgi:hypothetical protein